MPGVDPQAGSRLFVYGPLRSGREVRGDAESYAGPRTVLGYCVKYVARLETLELAAGELRPAALPDEAAPVEA